MFIVSILLTIALLIHTFYHVTHIIHSNTKMSLTVKYLISTSQLIIKNINENKNKKETILF